MTQTGTAQLRVTGLRVSRGGNDVLDLSDACFAVGQLNAVCGPNGAGKSTLLSCLAGSLTPTAGRVTINGMPIDQFSALQLATRRAVLGQSNALQAPYRVVDVVRLGRTPHHGTPRAAADRRVVRDVIDYTGIAPLAERRFLTLSGGEKQRVHLARTLVQVWDYPAVEPPWLLLDEPNSALDIRHQVALMRLLRDLAASGWGVVAVMHDLAAVRYWAAHCIVLKRGRLAASGAPAEVLTHAGVADAYDIAVADVESVMGAG